MTVIKPNSVAGINSITVQSGEALSVHKSDGSLIRTITSSSGVSTFTSASVGAATTDNNRDASINIGLGASISQHAANSLSLGTGGDERLRITSGGLVGVGQVTPTHMLHVDSSNASDTTATAFFKGRIIRFDGAASAHSPRLNFSLDGTDKAQILCHRTAIGLDITTLVEEPIKFKINSTEAFRINSSRDVGIGTDTMNAPLTVVNNDNAGYIASFRQKHASNSAQIIIDSPSDSNVRPSSIDLAQGGTVKWSLGQAYSSTSSQAFHIATSALQANESGSKLTITTAGSVGIGTAVPGQSLEVFKQSGTNLVKVSTQANSTIGIELQKTGSTTQSWRIADGQTVNGALEIYDVTDSATRLLIDGSGKFCFGTYNSGFANNDSVANFVNAASAGTENPLLTLWNPTTAGDARASIDFLTNDNSGTGRDGAFIRASNDGVTAKAHLQFGTIKDETYAELIRFQSTGGISFNGDTAAANALDDYEEGTFTPTNSIGLTLTNNNPAYYIKIGKLVMVQFDISFSGASDTAQCGLIQSLPFTSENTTDHFSQGPLPHISTNSNFDLDTSLDDLLLFVGPGESRIDIFSFSINTTAARSSLVGRRIRHMMFYKAA